MLKKILMAAACVGAFSAASAADEGGKWQVGVRAIGVIPQESATITTVGGDVNINNSYVPELDITYYFNPHWSVELIAATMKHKVHHVPTGLDLGHVWLLPPTLTVSYHFAPEGKFQPYIGAGLNYTIFYSQGGQAAAIQDVNYDNHIGYALVVGADIPINDHWKLNIDVKKIFLKTNVDVVLGPNTVAHADTKIDPWVIGIGARYTF